MRISDTEKKTIDYYDREAANWTAARGGIKDDTWWRLEMERFKELLPGGRVLEIGSGPGKDAAALTEGGYDYIGIDASKSFISIAKERNPGADFRLMSFNDLNFPRETFDGFWTVTTLLHVPKKEIDTVLSKIRVVVKPGGIGFITIKAGVGSKEDPETHRWFSYYSLKSFHKVLERNGFEIIDEKTREGQRGQYLCYWVKK